MNKKEQIAFTKATIEKVKSSGYKVGYFLSCIKMSPSHWHFIKKGERPLTDEKISIINEFINK